MLGHRLSVARIVLQTHLVIMALALVTGETGTGWRLVTEQTGHLLGRGLTDNAPDEFLLVLHVAAMGALAAALWLWARLDDWTPRAMRVTAASMFLLAPLGIPVGLLLLWLARHALDAEALSMPAIAGHRRALLSIAWTGAEVAVAAAGLGAFIVLAAAPMLWLPCMLGASLPGVGALMLIMAARPGLAAQGMPPLPERAGSSFIVPDEAAEA